MAGRSQTTSEPTRSGVTLLEVIVVSAIIFVLLGMLLPAIQRVRDAAARANCSNNLKEIGLALQNYNDTTGTLPPGNEDPTPGVGPTRSNWAIKLLPFLEHDSLFRAYDERFANSDTPNAPVRETFVRVYTCPADPIPHQKQNPSSGPGQNVEYMTANYRGMAGRGDTSNFYDFVNSPIQQQPSAKNLPYDWRGPLHIVMQSEGLTTEKLGNIPDGTSNTILVGEYATISQPKRRAYWAYSFAGYSIGSAMPDGRTLIPDFDQCAFALGAGELACSRGWGSFHAGGTVINFVMCDGSVRAISTGIQIDIFAYLGSIAGGEHIPETK